MALSFADEHGGGGTYQAEFCHANEYDKTLPGGEDTSMAIVHRNALKHGLSEREVLDND